MSGDGPEHADDERPPLLFHIELVGRSGGRGGAQCSDECAHQHWTLLGARRRLLEQTDEALGGRVTRNASSFDPPAAVTEPTGEPCNEQFIFAREIAIDRADCNTGLFGNRPHLNRVVASFTRHTHRSLEHPNPALVLSLTPGGGGRGHGLSVEHEPSGKRIAIGLRSRAPAGLEPKCSTAAALRCWDAGPQCSGAGGGGGRSEPLTAPSIAPDVSSRIDLRMSTPVAASICSDKDTTAAGS